MKQLLLFCLTFFSCFTSIIGQSIWINEINYDTPGADDNEFVEIAFIPGTNPEDYKLVFINGGDKSIYAQSELKGLSPVLANGYATVLLNYTNKVQNGAPDGIALIKNDSLVVQFLSYEGTINDWIFLSKTYNSHDILLADDNGVTDLTLQFKNFGINGSWERGSPSPGTLNSSQNDQVLSLNTENTITELNFIPENAEFYSVQGIKTDRIFLISGQLYIARWTMENKGYTRKVIYSY